VLRDFPAWSPRSATGFPGRSERWAR